MKHLDLSLEQPEENLACDEALLDEADESGQLEVIRFWESPRPFVAVGFSNSLSAEVNTPACAAAGIPILRRCSGGGTVLQGPGCLNYALVLSLENNSFLATITKANHFIMNRHCEALSALLGRSVEVRGVTDLAVDGRKFSGNAQRRKRRAMLFHGTFLVGMDFDLIETTLRFPSREPAYRARRPHRDFLTCIEVSAAELKKTLGAAWQAVEGMNDLPRERMESLVREKYSKPAWTRKFE